MLSGTKIIHVSVFHRKHTPVGIIFGLNPRTVTIILGCNNFKGKGNIPH